MRVSLWAALVICVAAGASYHNSFHGPFVFDDASSIVTNPTIRQLWPLSAPLTPPSTNVTAQGRPILNLSLAINHAVGGTAVQGYHIGNLIIHTLAGLTLFGLVRRTLRLRLVSVVAAGGPVGAPETGQANRYGGLPLRWCALAIAVLWTVHPLQTESVTYIIQRAESLVGLFYLLTFYCFVRSLGSRVGRDCPARALTTAGQAGWPGGPAQSGERMWRIFAVLTCLLGMATKEVMVTAPLMLFFFDRTFIAGTFLEAWRRRRGFYVALGSTWLLLAWLVAQTGGNRGGSVGFGVGVGWWEYWLTQFKAVGHYLWLSFWPHPLVFEYGSFWIRDFSEIVLHVVVVVGLLCATLVALWRRSAAGFLGAWFFGILAPTSLAPGTTQMIVEHRMYLPLAAVIALAVGAADRVIASRSRLSLFAAAIAVIAVALGLLTVRRNEDYRSDIRLWTDTIAKSPNNPLAHFMLAGAQERAGDIAGSMISYERTLELKPEFSIGHENFGELLLRQGRRADAIAHFQAALRLQPEYPDAHAHLGNAFLAEGRMDDALRHLGKAAELMPDSPMMHYNLGNALVAGGRANDAVAAFQAAVKLRPDMAEAHFNLANTLIETSRPAEAIAHYQAAVKLRAGYAAAHYNLGNALAASGRQEEAVAQYEAALRTRPDYPEAHHNLGSALFELGRLTDAAQHYEAALRLAPNFPNARENLERVRRQMRAR